MAICLITAAIPRTIDLFLGPHMKRLTEMGMTVHVASSDKPVVADEQNLDFHQVAFSRSSANIIGHFRAWREYRRLIDELTASGETVLLHLHTPIAAALARLAIRRSHPVKVLYMAHGLHFLPGERNVYYWIERAMARFTDLFVLINEDDAISANALSHDDSSRWTTIPGVGLQRVCADGSADGCADNGQNQVVTNVLPPRNSENHKRVMVVGLFEERKHPDLAIQTIALMDDNVHVHLCGDGPLEAQLRARAKSLGCEHRVHFEGWTKDVLSYYQDADCLLFLSEREGLPMSVAEALASQLAVVAYDIRGVRDLLQGLNGWKIPESRAPAAVAQAVQAALDTQIDSDAYSARTKMFSLDASLDAHEAAVRKLMQTGLRGVDATPRTSPDTQPQT